MKRYSPDNRSESTSKVRDAWARSEGRTKFSLSILLLTLFL